MTEPIMLERLLDQARVAPEVYALRPDYRALLLAVDGLVPGPSDAASEALLQEAVNRPGSRGGHDLTRR